jgi:hypothetical protein
LLEEHGWLVKIPHGAVVDGQRRRDAWQIEKSPMRKLRNLRNQQENCQKNLRKFAPPRLAGAKPAKILRTQK